MNYNKQQLFFLAALRILVGWHFFFEGLIKLFNPGWTSKGYLLSAEGLFAPIFKWLGGSSLVGIADAVTTAFLLIVGLTLLLGIFEKVGAYIGIVLLAFFYLSHPSWPGLPRTGPAEGNYWIVNKNLIEMAALGVLAYFPTGHLLGLEMFRKRPEQETA